MAERDQLVSVKTTTTTPFSSEKSTSPFTPSSPSPPYEKPTDEEEFIDEIRSNSRKPMKYFRFVMLIFLISGIIGSIGLSQTSVYEADPFLAYLLLMIFGIMFTVLWVIIECCCFCCCKKDIFAAFLTRECHYWIIADKQWQRFVDFSYGKKKQNNH